jgi:hypothetical protein
MCYEFIANNALLLSPRDPGLGNEPDLAHGFGRYGILFRDRLQSPEPKPDWPACTGPTV